MFKKFGASMLVFVLALFLYQGTSQASSQVLMAKEESVKIFENRGGVLSEMGQMRLGEPLLLHKDYGEHWWQVKFGNGYGYIRKKDVQVQGNVKVPAVNNKPNSNTAVLIQQDAEVFDNSRGGLKPFAVVKSGYRYPVLEDFGNFWKVDVGGRTGFVAKKLAPKDSGIPVLMYHHILTPEQKADSQFAKLDTTITNVEFNKQMDFLKESGYTTLSTKDLEGYLNRQVNVPAKSVVITIDDGNISSRIYAYPKLKEHGFVADQFIITNRTPKSPLALNHKSLQFLSQQEMNEMADVYNYEAHTHALHSLTAKNRSFFVDKSNAEVKKDMQLNQKLLNGTRYFAYPFGQYNQDKVNLLRSIGFTMAYTTKDGKAKLGVDKMLIPRIGIVPNLPLNQFAAKIGAPPLPVKPPAPEKDPNALFTDVTTKDEFYDAVKNLTERGVIKGYADGSFKPYQQVTRGQAAKILANVLKLDVTATASSQFTDVSVSNEYHGAIAALSKEGIINGYPDGTFKPGNPLTRAQMAKIVTRGFTFEEQEMTESRFTDVKPTDEFAGYVQTLLTNNITKGTSATTFSPAKFVTRGQLALFVIRAENAKATTLQIEPKEVAPQAEQHQLTEALAQLEAGNWQLPVEGGAEASDEAKLTVVTQYVEELLTETTADVQVEAAADGRYVFTLTIDQASTMFTQQVVFSESVVEQFIEFEQNFE